MPAAGRKRLTGAMRWALPVGVVLFVAWHLWGLLRTPPPFVDEAWNANRAVAMLQTGIPFGTLDSGVFDHLPQADRYFPWLGTAIWTVPILLGGPDLYAMRAGALVMALALLAATIVWARQLAGPAVGWCTGLLLATSLPFLLAAHQARTDGPAAALGMAMLALGAAGRADRRPWRAALAGLLLAPALEMHFNSAIFAPALLVELVVLPGARPLRVLPAAGAGMLVGGLLWAAYHLLPDPQAYATLFALGNGTSRTPPLVDAGAWWDALGAALDVGWSTLLGYLPLAGVAAVAVWRSRAPADRALVVVCATVVLAWLALVRAPRLYYAITAAPALLLPLATWLVQLAPGRGPAPAHPGLARALRMVIWTLAGVTAVISQAPLLRNASADYETTLAEVRTAVPAGSTVLGPQIYWFARPADRFLSWEQLIYYRRAHPGSSLGAAMAALHPDVVISSPWLEGAIWDPASIAALPWAASSVLVRPEWDAWIARHTVPTQRIPSMSLGPTVIYTVRHDRDGED